MYSLAEKEPFAIFHFKYRSLGQYRPFQYTHVLTYTPQASLKALGIVPRDEAMTVPLEDRPEEELTPDELRELVRRMRQVCILGFLWTKLLS